MNEQKIMAIASMIGVLLMININAYNLYQNHFNSNDDIEFTFAEPGDYVATMTMKPLEYSCDLEYQNGNTSLCFNNTGVHYGGEYNWSLNMLEDVKEVNHDGN